MFRRLLLMLGVCSLAACDNPVAPTNTQPEAPVAPPSRRVVATSGIIDLGMPNGATSLQSFDVNANGEVVGYSTDDKGRAMGFVWEGNSFRTLTPLQTYQQSFAYSLNGSGSAAGISLHANGTYRATLWNSRGVPTDLGAFTKKGDSYAMSVNLLGAAAGFATSSSGQYHAFYYNNWTKRLTDLGVLSGGTYSLGQDVNDWGEVVGYGDTPNGDRAFLWNWWTGEMTDLGVTSNGLSTYGLSVNNREQVVGFAFTKAGYPHAFFWENGTMTDLGTLGGNQSVAFGINNDGEVVGYSQVPGGEFHAFVWTAVSGLVDLGTLPGGVVSYAQSINSNGQTAGIGQAPDGTPHAVRWQVTLQ